MEIKEKKKQKDIFFAALIHEIRNPLNALLGSIDLFQKHLGSFQSDQIEILQNQKYSGEVLQCLVNNILDASKIKNSEFSFVYEKVDIRSLIYKVAQVNKQNAVKKGIDIITEVSPEVPEFLILDEVRIIQIIMNFASNGVKFTSKGYVKVKIE